MHLRTGIVALDQHAAVAKTLLAFCKVYFHPHHIRHGRLSSMVIRMTSECKNNML